MKRISFPFHLGLITAVAVTSTVAAATDTNDCPLTNREVADAGRNAKVILVGRIDGPASDYKSDGDVETLEVIRLTDGMSRVSDDGQIIFLQKDLAGKEQQELLLRAFYIRAVLKRNLTSVCEGPWTHK